MPVMSARLLTLLPFGFFERSAGASAATALRSVACMSANNWVSLFHALALTCCGRVIQLEPSSGNDPRCALVNRRHATYFQYAACTTSSQML